MKRVGFKRDYWGSCACKMEDDPKGDYVSYEDYKKLEAKLKAEPVDDRSHLAQHLNPKDGKW